MTGRQSWSAYDRASLDLQYDATKTVPSVDPYFERYLSESERVRNNLPSLLDEPYGYEERMSLDLFPARSPGAPALLYLHGGYWRRLGYRAFQPDQRHLRYSKCFKKHQRKRNRSGKTKRHKSF